VIDEEILADEGNLRRQLAHPTMISTIAYVPRFKLPASGTEGPRVARRATRSLGRSFTMPHHGSLMRLTMHGPHSAFGLVAALLHLIFGLRAWRNGHKAEAVSHLVKMIYHLMEFVGSSGR
jgi:hypothetical protein